jgi:Ribosomal protein S8
MSMTDPVADMLTRIRNAQMAQKNSVGASEDQQFNLLIVRTKLSCFTY